MINLLVQICAGYSAARGVQVLTTVRAKFYFLYICMALFMAAVAVAVASFSGANIQKDKHCLKSTMLSGCRLKLFTCYKKSAGSL